MDLDLYTPAMFEYHGWITLRSIAEAVDDEPPLRLAEIQSRVNELAGYALMDLRPMNGQYFIHFGGFPNHRGTHGPALLDLLTEIGRIASGSYGLMYLHDDEDPHHGGNFRVLRLVRGTVTERPDLLLSPVIPTLEDEYVDGADKIDIPPSA